MDLLAMATEHAGILDGPDGRARCFWHGNLPDYLHYHDHEWGRPVTDDRRLFEKVCLEGFQSGLSWLTILRKRENFREAFAGFDFDKVADALKSLHVVDGRNLLDREALRRRRFVYQGIGRV